jgi:hypothetical protein
LGFGALQYRINEFNGTLPGSIFEDENYLPFKSVITGKKHSNSRDKQEDT